MDGHDDKKNFSAVHQTWALSFLRVKFVPEPLGVGLVNWSKGRSVEAICCCSTG